MIKVQSIVCAIVLLQQLLSGGAADQEYRKEYRQRGGSLKNSQQLRNTGAETTRDLAHHYFDDSSSDDYSSSSSDEDGHYYGKGYGKGKGGKKSKKSKGKGKGKGGKKSKKSKGKGKGGSDDGRGTVLVTTETVSPPAETFIGPDGIEVDPLSLGSVFIFSNRTRNVQNLEDFVFPAFANGEEAAVLGMVDGYCTRTGEMMNSIVAYCHFTYSIFDAADMALLGTVVAHGALPPSPTAGVLTVTGGTGYFVGAMGLVEIVGCLLVGDPPMLVSSNSTTDVLFDVDAYVHYIEFEVDEFFFSGDGASGEMPIPL